MYKKNIFQENKDAKSARVVRPALSVDSFGNVYVVDSKSHIKSSRNVRKTSELVSKYRR